MGCSNPLSWVKGLSLVAKIILGLAMLCGAVGLIGYMVWYGMWEEDLKWYTDLDGNYKKAVETALPNIKQLYSLVSTGLSLCTVSIVAFIVALVLGVLCDFGCMVKIALLVGGICSLATGIVGIVLAAKTGEKDASLEKLELSYCQKAGYGWLPKIKGFTENNRKYCQDSTATNAAMSAIIIVCVILGVIIKFLA